MLNFKKLILYTKRHIFDLQKILREKIGKVIFDIFQFLISMIKCPDDSSG